MYPDAKEHSKEAHIKDYNTEDDYYFVMDSLENIIKYSDYVFYDKSKKRFRIF